MQEITEILGKDTLTRADLFDLRYLVTQGDAEDAFERMTTVESAVWRIVTSPDYTGDITLEDLE